MQNLKGIPPQDAFSISEFDIVIYYDRELGRDSFGELFEGNWHGTKVAIKRIRNFHPAVSRTTSMNSLFVTHMYLACWKRDQNHETT